jgi:hypothetical protein
LIVVIRSSFRFDGVEQPAAGHALERELAALVEGEPGLVRHPLQHGGGDEHLVRGRAVDDASADADVEPGALLVRDPAGAGVGADAHAQPERLGGFAHRAAEADGSSGIGEDREQPVPGRVHLPPAPGGELAPDQGLILLEQPGPALVTDLGGEVRRVDDVDEQHGRRLPVPGRRFERAHVQAPPPWMIPCGA